MTNKMIERVAKAIYATHIIIDEKTNKLVSWEELEAWQAKNPQLQWKVSLKQFCINAAKHAIAAMREPTEEMLFAADDGINFRFENIKEGYQIMIDAALKEE